MKEGYLRGEIAKKANVNAETLRYYEKHGLIPSPMRTDSGYRLYSEEVLHLLAFIKNAKSCGFTLKEINKALTQSEASHIRIEDFVNVIERKIDSLNREIAARERTKQLLSDLKSSLQAAEKHPEVQEVLQILNINS
ncbi:MerR family transcriptional regulator [Paenibacillus puerhi]|uniref:MerR family transcriptional regulator n=1 Tax=Paenibacillus puerhi TaxID=2692622 RepID=UPI0013598D9B|nr:MerR family transcriptional regulator [Paenibacillus puerhi]